VSDREVVLAADARQPTRDVYDRLLAYVYVSGELVNEALLAGGFARELTVGAGYEKTKEFKRAQAVAREGEAGLWATCD
jgi:micrococcal nuclease